jgi:carboxymethylenebutenolidase
MDHAMTAGTVTIEGGGGDPIEAYQARPSDSGARGGVVVIHHLPGYDRATKEVVRRLADAGFDAICPNLYSREAPGASPDDAAAAVRAAGGIADSQLIADVAAAAAHLRSLPGSNGRVGVIGHCSGGRQTVLAACAVDVQAAVDCYGAFVVEPRTDGMPSTMQPIRDQLPELRCPLLGLFGVEDKHPSPEHVAELDRLLTQHGKVHEFHSYEGAGHAFFAVDRPSYRPEAAVDGWSHILRFFTTHLQG